MPDGIVGPSDKMDIRLIFNEHNNIKWLFGVVYILFIIFYSRFTSDGTVQRTGFKLQVDCVDKLTAEKILRSEEFEEPEQTEKIKIKNQFISGSQNFAQRPKKLKEPKKPRKSEKQDGRRKNGQNGKKNSGRG